MVNKEEYNNQKATLNYMRLPEDFWAFNSQLANSHLFQQKVIPAWQDNDVTVM